MLYTIMVTKNHVPIASYVILQIDIEYYKKQLDDHIKNLKLGENDFLSVDICSSSESWFRFIGEIK